MLSNLSFNSGSIYRPKRERDNRPFPPPEESPIHATSSSARKCAGDSSADGAMLFLQPIDSFLTQVEKRCKSDNMPMPLAMQELPGRKRRSPADRCTLMKRAADEKKEVRVPETHHAEMIDGGKVVCVVFGRGGQF